MRKRSTKSVGLTLLSVAVTASMISTPAIATTTVITDINFSGLHRLTTDSLYPLIPITVGSIPTEADLAASVKALYASGYFSNVQANITGTALEFVVEERPVIAELTFEGNKLIPDEGLEIGLKKAGLAEGELLKQSTLFGVANELQEQYIQQGYYNSDIDVKQELIKGNRAKVAVEFTEGKQATVVDINVIGNSHFSDREIKNALLLKEHSWVNIISQSDRFAQEKLDASIGKLRKMYRDAGFVKFSIDNSVINVSEDKQKIFIELSLNEGSKYKFGDISFLGKHPFKPSELKNLVKFSANSQYSQSQLDATTKGLLNHFGNSGYYYANIKPVPRINDESKTVDIDFYLDPARPIYVNRINFSGNIKTADEVLRREMRQLESSPASNEKIALSKTRLLRTGYFKNVIIDVKPTENKPDNIDINYIVEEQSSGASTFMAGYSKSGGLTLQAGIEQNNFLGTGNKINASVSRSETRDAYSIGYANPFFTKDGISQSASIYYRNTKYDDKNVSNYVTDSMGGSLRHGYPVNENIRVNAGLSIDNTDLKGGRWMGISNVSELIDDGGTVVEYDGDNTGKYNFNKDYTTYNLLLGWTYNSLNTPVFPSKGMSHGVDLTVGFGDKEYQKVTYKGNIYQPIYKGLIARGYAKLGYGNETPFYENFYAGGYGSVRGYDASSLGPRSTTFYDTQVDKDYLPEEVGGNAIATFGAELILPMPFKGDWTNKVRPVLFAEGGQVFDTTDKEDRTFVFKEKDTGIPLLQQDNEVRYSAGAGITWYTPIGPISLSYSKPFNNQTGDKIEELQFQIGNSF